jgi:hypothetical protein
MKRTSWIFLAAALVLLSSGWAIYNGYQNRRIPAGGTLELTERELALPPVIGDSTALLVRLLWRVDRPYPEDHRSPSWLGVAKLTDLGFDCGIAPTAPHARAHYRSMPAALVYVALRLEENPPDPKSANRHDGAAAGSQLVLIDAAEHPEPLRHRFPDPEHVIARAVLHVRLQEHDEQGRPLPKPRISGVIQHLVPQEIFVPAPGSRLLQPLRQRPHGSEDKPRQAPRFASKVHWGQHYEPWLTDVRLLTNGTLHTKNNP